MNRVMTFPDDYPRSKAFHRKNDVKENIQQDTLDLFSKFKNNLLLSSAESFDQLASVIVNCPWGGTPEKGDILYAIKTTGNDERYETIHSGDVAEEDKQKVGVVTSGLYSLIRGRGYGIGSINMSLVTPSNAAYVYRGGKRDQRLVWLERGQHFVPITFNYMR
jgi:hypothetical protein